MPRQQPIRLKMLMQSALGSANWRGHEMRPFRQTSDHTAESDCKHCGRWVFVDSEPAPNGIDVAGEAVALGCNRMRVGAGVGGVK